jgi:PTS system mannitol-specific IIC component
VKSNFKIFATHLTLKISGYGSFLSQSIMPNISAFIAWGLLTALFTKNGWMPSLKLEVLIEPMMLYALPLIIAYTGGRRFGGDRGGAIGVIATMGLIVGSPVPMILGAMLLGPFSGWVLHKLDRELKRYIPMGFEMLSSNFTAALLGTLFAILSFSVVGPVIAFFDAGITTSVTYVVDRGLLFLSAVFIEPAKVLFLNNALNHGVLSPLGMQYTLETGRSTFFLLETNPGPGLGVLLAYIFYGTQGTKRTASTASVIHFLGGIHEIYFPYVLMQPLLILPLIVGGLSGNLFFQLQGAGLVATPSPGSIVALLALAPKDSFISVLIGIALSTGVTFLLSSLILYHINKSKVHKMTPTISEESPWIIENFSGKDLLSKVFVACDAGMGSSALGASLLSRILAQKGIKASIKNTSLEHVDPDATLVVTYKSLIERAKKQAPHAGYIGLNDFLEKDAYEEALTMILQQETIKPNSILQMSNILIRQPSVKKEDAIKQAGDLLVKSGYVEKEYVEGMLSREEKFSTYIGSGVAIPHGENNVKQCVRASGIVVIQYPDGIDFGEGKIAHLVIGIAGKGNEHIQILSNIAETIEDEGQLAELLNTQDPQIIYNAFSKGDMSCPF